MRPREKSRRGFRRQQKGLVRRSLRGSAAGAGGSFFESENHRRRPGHRGHGAHRTGNCSASAAGLDGRQIGDCAVSEKARRKRLSHILLAALLTVGADHYRQEGDRHRRRRHGPGFVERHWADLPNLDRLRHRGSYSHLATTTPPQSPVAWSTFITGLDPGRTRHLRFRASRPDDARTCIFRPTRRSDRVSVFRSGRMSCRCRVRMWCRCAKGGHFGSICRSEGIPVTIVRIPANYPPSAAGNELAGMGTPDLRGTQGTFSYYTDDPAENVARGGRRSDSKVEVSTAATSTCVWKARPIRCARIMLTPRCS
jgi:hypothetical protein